MRLSIFTNLAPDETEFRRLQHFGRYVHYWTCDFWNGPTFNWNDEQDAGFHLTHNDNVHSHLLSTTAQITTTSDPLPIAVASTSFDRVIGIEVLGSRRLASRFRFGFMAIHPRLRRDGCGEGACVVGVLRRAR